jgi:hypothetical protein
MKRYTLFHCILLFSLISYSQADSIKYNELLLGKVYQQGSKRIDGHPFIESTDFHLCKLTYRDIVYENLMVNYDLENQEIILYQTFNLSVPSYIILNSGIISDFEIKVNNRICHFSSAFNKIKGINTEIRFYEVIHNGKTKYIVGRNKQIKELAINGKIDSYIQTQFNYLIVNDNLTRVSNKKDLLNALPGFSKEIRSFIKQNNLKIRVDNYNDIQKLLSFYDSLLK